VRVVVRRGFPECDFSSSTGTSDRSKKNLPRKPRSPPPAFKSHFAAAVSARWVLVRASGNALRALSVVVLPCVSLKPVMSQRQVTINASLARCALASDVLAIVRRDVAEFNVVNCGTALSRIARAPDGRRLVARNDDNADIVSLLETAAGLVRHHCRHVESRQLASLLHACGKLGVCHDLMLSCDLLASVTQCTGIHAEKFNPQELSNSLWGCAKLGVGVDHEIITLLGDNIAASLKKGGKGGTDWRADWTAQGVSNVAWALATLGARDLHVERTELLVTLFGIIQLRAKEFNAQEVANVLWAIAKMSENASENNCETTTDPTRTTETGPQNEPEASRAAHRASKALASQLTKGWFAEQKRNGKLESQHVANVAWACGRLGLGGGCVAARVAGAAAAAAPSMNCQELSMVSWAVAAFDERHDEDVLTVIANACAQSARSATPQQLATSARAFAKLGFRSDLLMDAVADAVLALPKPLENQLLPQDVANLLWAFAKLGLGETKRHKKLFHALAGAARKQMRRERKKGDGDDEEGDGDDGDENTQSETQVKTRGSTSQYSPQQLTMLVWAHGMLGHSDAAFLNACVTSVRERLRECNARDLTNLTWGFAALGVTAEQKPTLIARIARNARRQFGEFNSQELLKFLGAFQRIGGTDAKLTKLVSERKTVVYDFPALVSLAAAGDDISHKSVTLTSATPTSFRGTKKEKKRVDDSCGGSGRGNTGVALWEGSFVLAEWLSRQSDPEDPVGDISNSNTGANWGTGGWHGKTGVELGAGLGLPSIVASKLGVAMVATDGAWKFRDFGILLDPLLF
jgi:hypothetical protein